MEGKIIFIDNRKEEVKKKGVCFTYKQTILKSLDVENYELKWSKLDIIGSKVYQELTRNNIIEELQNHLDYRSRASLPISKGLD